MQIILPQKVKQIIETLQKEGFEAYAVGGCVRDSLLNKEPNDWDITTNALPDQIKSLFRRTVDIGIEHGTVKVMLGDDGYEVTTYRIDGIYEDNRHPKQVTFTGLLREDLRRRDFTVNAMAYNDEEGVVDLFGGIQDLKDGVIRAVGDPNERFDEDALRIMRALRFAAQLSFTIEDNTRTAIRKFAGNLSDVSAERIREELEKILVSPHPEMMREAYEYGITRVILPEWDVAMECSQNNPHHFTNVGEHTIIAMMDCCARDKDLDAFSRKCLRIALFMHDFAKPVCKTTDPDGTEHFKKHPEVGAGMVVDILRRLRYDNATIHVVEKLVRYHDERPRVTLPSMRRFMVDVSPENIAMLTILKQADLAAHSDYQMDEKVAFLTGYEKLTAEIFAAHDPLSMAEMAVCGGDLINEGIPAGVIMGDVLRELFDEILIEPSHNTKEYLLPQAMRIYRKIKDTV